MQFKVTATDGAARCGVLETAHGTIDTPVFMPVGTYGAVKGMRPEELRSLGAQIVLGNTFHLWLRPGLEVIAAHGGLHRFMGWDGPILTDSGGFQVFSLGDLRKITEEGVKFQSPVNGDACFLTPEESMRIQQVLNSDIVMAFDECTPYPATLGQAQESMQLSMRWAARSKAAHAGNANALCGIVQGGIHERLRDESLAALQGIGFDGSAIEGLARVHEADMLVKPDPSTFQVLPWRGDHHGTARMFCDVLTPDGEAALMDPRNVLKRCATIRVVRPFEASFMACMISCSVSGSIAGEAVAYRR